MKLNKDAAERLEAYFADDPSPEVVASMEAWLRKDKANPRLFAEYGLIDRLISHEQKNQDASAIFASLLEAEEAAVPIIVEKPVVQTIQLDREPRDAISFKQACAALSYLTSQSLRNKAGQLAGIAAVLVLSVVLIFVFRGGPSDTPQANPIANDDTARPTVVEPVKVATLTATYNAVWIGGPASAGLQAGDTLHAGDRLTLTAGFAQITTNRGAIAILEAPATIELIDSPNAMRLHTGKLVGICESESSKGFLVRTPHMDVTDLGTRFGVDAEEDATIAHVFEGEIQAAIADAPPQTKPITLLAEQSVRRSVDTDVITRVDSAMERFASILPETEVFLTSTGQGLVVGDVDPSWRIIEIDGQKLETPVSLPVFDDPPTRVFGPQDANWVGIKTSDYQWEKKESRYTIHTQVEIPDETNLGFATLVLRFHPDDEMASLTVNGQAFDVPANHVLTSPIYEISLADGLVHGRNDVKLEIIDRRPKHVQENYIGIRASWYLITRQTPFEGGIPAP